MGRLRIAALFGGVRGEAPVAVQKIAQIAVKLGAVVHAAAGKIASVDINPLMVGLQDGVCAVDALVEMRMQPE
jgi:hypothetical protein